MVELEEKVRRMEIGGVETTVFGQGSEDRWVFHRSQGQRCGHGRGSRHLYQGGHPFHRVNNSHGLPDSKLEALIIDLNSATLHRMTYVNVYRPPSRRAHQVQDFSTSELPTAQNIIIRGDLNVHASSWDQW